MKKFSSVLIILLSTYTPSFPFLNSESWGQNGPIQWSRVEFIRIHLDTKLVIDRVGRSSEESQLSCRKRAQHKRKRDTHKKVRIVERISIWPFSPYGSKIFLGIQERRRKLVWKKFSWFLHYSYINLTSHHSTWWNNHQRVVLQIVRSPLYHSYLTLRCDELVSNPPSLTWSNYH